MVGFSPILFPNNKVDLNKVNLKGMNASLKYDGIRCLFIDGLMLSRSLKKIPNN